MRTFHENNMSYWGNAQYGGGFPAGMPPSWAAMMQQSTQSRSRVYNLYPSIPVGVVCYKCKAVGHYANECPFAAR